MEHNLIFEILQLIINLINQIEKVIKRVKNTKNCILKQYHLEIKIKLHYPIIYLRLEIIVI